MRIIGVIPARFASSRLHGKPLADICGKPMIWWVYNQVAKVKSLDKVVVATDDERIETVCKEFGFECIMTSDKHSTHLSRLTEAAEKLDADLYVCVCGDEPLIEPDIIEQVIPEKEKLRVCEPYVSTLIREITSPVELIDPSNIKILVNDAGYCKSLSRAVVPFPYKTIEFNYTKLVGVECYNKEALRQYAKLPIGKFEKIEDITLMRFWENNIPIFTKTTLHYQLSVDTPKDLERVVNVLRRKMNL